MKKKKRIQIPPISVSKQVYDAIEIEALVYGHSMSGYVRWLIELGRQTLK